MAFISTDGEGGQNTAHVEKYFLRSLITEKKLIYYPSKSHIICLILRDNISIFAT
jgi:hypothetical protein